MCTYITNIGRSFLSELIRRQKMGVQGLWELLAPVGRRVSVETLSGKKLAIGIHYSNPSLQVL